MNFNAGVPGCSGSDVDDPLSQRGRGRHSVPIQAFCRGLQPSLPLTLWSGLGHIALSFGFLSRTMGSSWSSLPRVGQCRVPRAGLESREVSAQEDTRAAWKGTPSLCRNWPRSLGCTWIMIPQRPHRSGREESIPGTGKRAETHRWGISAQ